MRILYLHRSCAGIVACLAGAALAGDAPAEKGGGATALETKSGGSKTFYVDGRAGNNQVSFTSESTLEDFTGVCNQVRGECSFDPKRVESLAGTFSLKVADMRTGIDLRDEHLRSADWLDGAKNPEISVAVKQVEDVKKTGPTAASLTLVGTCTIKGQTRDVRIPATVAYLDETPETMKRVKGDLIRIRAEFKVKLSEYGVTGPKSGDMIGLKVSDEIAIKVAVFGSTEKPADDLKIDKQPTPTGPTQVDPPKRPGA